MGGGFLGEMFIEERAPIEIVKLLILKGADINARNKKGLTALGASLIKGAHRQFIQELENLGATE